MAPAIGDIVLVKLRDGGQARYINGSDEHPAIVTAVHVEDIINARVLQDENAQPLWCSSIMRGDIAEGYSGSTWRERPPREVR